MWWTTGPSSPYWNWFFIRQWPFQEGETRDGRYFSFAFHGGMPKLNTNNPDVQEYLTALCESWVQRYDIDAIRFDVGNEIAHSFLRRLRAASRPGSPALPAGRDLARRPRLAGRGRVRRRHALPPAKRHPPLFRGQGQPAAAFSWDVGRCMSVYAPQVNTVQFTLLDSHDTIRLRNRVSGEAEYWQQLAALFTLPGSPCVYYGTELMLEGGPDPDCRRCMPWARLEAEGPHPVLCQLIALRRQEPAFQSSEIQFLPGEGRLVRYRRGEPGPGQLEVCLNAGRQPEAVGPGGARPLCPGVGRRGPGPRRHPDPPRLISRPPAPRQAQTRGTPAHHCRPGQPPFKRTRRCAERGVFL